MGQTGPGDSALVPGGGSAALQRNVDLFTFQLCPAGHARALARFLPLGLSASVCPVSLPEEHNQGVIPMKLTPEQLEAELLQLPPAVRARLAEALLDSLEEADTELDRAWAEEAERRYQELKGGTVTAVPAAEALAKARARLNDSR